MKKAFVFIISVLMLQMAAMAGGWLQGKGRGYFKLNQYMINGSQIYDKDGKPTGIGETGIYLTSLYGEYGIAKNFDLIGYVPFISRTAYDGGDLFKIGNPSIASDVALGIGDSFLALKYGIRQNKSFVISAAFLVGLPFGDPNAGESGYLQTGDGEFNQQLSLLFGYGFKYNFYANLEMGFNNRTKSYSDELIGDFEFGYEWKEKVIISIKVVTVNSLMNGDDSKGKGIGIYSNNREYVSFGPEISYRINKKFGISANYFTASSGRNIIAVPSYSFGIFMELK